MQQLIDRCAQLFKSAVRVNRETDFGVDFMYNPVLDGIEVIVHPSKERNIGHIMWETVYFDHHDAHERLEAVEDAIGGILTHGIFTLPALFSEQD